MFEDHIEEQTIKCDKCDGAGNLGVRTIKGHRSLGKYTPLVFLIIGLIVGIQFNPVIGAFLMLLGFVFSMYIENPYKIEV